jgi:hypothetical protein
VKLLVLAASTIEGWASAKKGEGAIADATTNVEVARKLAVVERAEA